MGADGAGAARGPMLRVASLRLRMRIERSDFIASFGLSSDRRFVVVLAPESAWSGEAMMTFIVTGSRAVRLSGGRAQLPELLLDGDCDA